MEEERTKCPYCSELIIKDAKKCRFCGEWFKEKNKPEVNSKLKIFQPLREATDEPPKPKPQRKIEEPKFDLSKSNIEKPGVIPLGRERRTNWSRLILSIVYLGIIIAFVVYEINAQKILHNGQALEKRGMYQEASDKYLQVIKDYRLSFCVIAAHRNYQKIQEQLETKVSIDSVYWFPFVAWPVCSVLLFLIFVTRIHRPGVAFVAFLFLLLGVFGSAVQLSWDGLVSIKPLDGIIQQFEKEPMSIFIASYLLLIVTALMTLTATRKFPFGHFILESKKNGR
jgi:magnesium-transporting ATPase (P-type)